MYKKLLWLKTLWFVSSLSAVQLNFYNWDIGKVKAGEIIKNSNLIIKNDSSRPIEFAARPSCKCIKVLYNKNVLQGGEKLPVYIEFNSTGYNGQVKFSVFITTDDKTIPFRITANVMGKLDTATYQAKNLESEAVIPRGPTSIEIIYFYSYDCTSCRKIKQKLIPEIEKKSGVNILLKEFDISEKENFEKLISIEEKLNHKSKLLPVMIVGKDIIEGERKIWTELYRFVEKYKTGIKSIDIETKTDNISEKIHKRFKSISILPVLFAGLLDGINPCAFTTIIFLISYLTFIKQSSRNILISGLSFTIAVFITYFLIGLGLFKFLISIKGFDLISKIVNILIALFAYILGFLSFYDYLLSRKGEIEDMRLQLPKFLKSKIHQVVREHTKSSKYFVSAFFIGILVSLFELACTGQVYLPTIIYIAKVSFHGILYLIIYNLMFILPLIIIFLIFYYGVKADIIGTFLKKKVPGIKLGTAILFVLLGSLILIINL